MSKHNQLPVSSPEDQGISSAAILDFVEEIERRGLELHGFMLLRHGHIVARGWWKPYQPEIPHMAYSLTKSFTSIAAGFAVQEGLLSVDDQVLAYFPEIESEDIWENMKDLKVKHLLTMTTGHDKDTMEFKVMSSFLHSSPDIRIAGKDGGEYIRGFFELPLTHAPGTFFVYNSGASQVLGTLIERITGDHLIDYLMPRLFDPLGIEKPMWDRRPGGGNTGGWGLRITTEDLARFGQFLLNKGTWNGRRILPVEWIEEATTRQVDNTISQPQGSNVDWTQGYGYQFWRCRHHAYRGDGAFGQFCLVLPEQDAVLAINGGLSDMQGVLDAVWGTLLTTMQTQPLQADPLARDRLDRALASLELCKRQRLEACSVVGSRSYEFEDNDHELYQLTLEFVDDECKLCWMDRTGLHRLTCGLLSWSDVQWFGGRMVAARGEWHDSNMFTIHIRTVDSPHLDKLVCKFIEDELQVQYEHLNFVTLTQNYKGTAV